MGKFGRISATIVGVTIALIASSFTHEFVRGSPPDSREVKILNELTEQYAKSGRNSKVIMEEFFRANLKQQLNSPEEVKNFREILIEVEKAAKHNESIRHKLYEHIKKNKIKLGREEGQEHIETLFTIVGHDIVTHFSKIFIEYISSFKKTLNYLYLNYNEIRLGKEPEYSNFQNQSKKTEEIEERMFGAYEKNLLFLQNVLKEK